MNNSNNAFAVSFAHVATHKEFGNLGKVDFGATVESAELNGEPLGKEAVAYLIGYGIKQVFTDCYSSAKTAAEKKGLEPKDVAREMLFKKIEAVQSGRISIRESLDPFARVMNELTLKAFADNAGMTFAKFAASIDDEDKANEVYDKFAESVRDQLAPIARERLERESKLGKGAPVSVADILKGLEKPVSTLEKKGSKK